MNWGKRLLRGGIPPSGNGISVLPGKNDPGAVVDRESGKGNGCAIRSIRIEASGRLHPSAVVCLAVLGRVINS